MNKVKFNGDLVTGETDLDTAEIICIPSKPRYADVDLCLRDDSNSSSVQIGEISASYLEFEERIKIGKEIEKRWMEHKKSNWISVKKEGLPDCELVLAGLFYTDNDKDSIFFGKRLFYQTVIEMRCDPDNVYLFDADDNQYDEWDYSEFTHWKKLEPPEEV